MDSISHLQQSHFVFLPVIGFSLHMQVILNLRGGDFRGAWKVDYFAALFLQEIEFPLPVISHYKGVHMIFLHICPLLLPVLLRDHKIHIPDRFQKLFSLFVGKIAFLLLLIPVEFVCGKAHDQIISILLGSSKQIDMSIVKQVEGSIRNYSFHFIRASPFCGALMDAARYFPII